MSERQRNEKLTFNNEVEVKGHLLETETRLFLYIYGMTFDEVYQLVKEPENTKVIKWEHIGVTGTVKGYKKLMSISVELNDMISVALRK